jgi:hypothetical protein
MELRWKTFGLQPRRLSQNLSPFCKDEAERKVSLGIPEEFAMNDPVWHRDDLRRKTASQGRRCDYGLRRFRIAFDTQLVDGKCEQQSSSGPRALAPLKWLDGVCFHLMCSLHYLRARKTEPLIPS